MIIRVDICVKEVCRLGRQYAWPRPEACLRCHGRIWGHGFFEAYFDGFDQPLLLRKYRCPDCGCVFRMRPKDYWPRFQASISTIRESLESKFSLHRWLAGLPLRRQLHWLTGLLIQIKHHLGLGWSGDPLDAFDRLTEMGFCAVSESIESGGGVIFH